MCPRGTGLHGSDARRWPTWQASVPRGTSRRGLDLQQCLLKHRQRLDRLSCSQEPGRETRPTRDVGGNRLRRTSRELGPPNQNARPPGFSRLAAVVQRSRRPSQPEQLTRSTWPASSGRDCEASNLAVGDLDVRRAPAAEPPRAGTRISASRLHQDEPQRAGAPIFSGNSRRAAARAKVDRSRLVSSATPAWRRRSAQRSADRWPNQPLGDRQSQSG